MKEYRFIQVDVFTDEPEKLTHRSFVPVRIASLTISLMCEII